MVVVVVFCFLFLFVIVCFCLLLFIFRFAFFSLNDSLSKSTHFSLPSDHTRAGVGAGDCAEFAASTQLCHWRCTREFDGDHRRLGLALS